MDRQNRDETLYRDALREIFRHDAKTIVAIDALYDLYAPSCTLDIFRAAVVAICVAQRDVRTTQQVLALLREAAAYDRGVMALVGQLMREITQCGGRL